MFLTEPVQVTQRIVQEFGGNGTGALLYYFFGENVFINDFRR
jgi:hypothetical protein